VSEQASRALPQPVVLSEVTSALLVASEGIPALTTDLRRSSHDIQRRLG
jgi:hypothetical protein